MTEPHTYEQVAKWRRLALSLRRGEADPEDPTVGSQVDAVIDALLAERQRADKAEAHEATQREMYANCRKERAEARNWAAWFAAERDWQTQVLAKALADSAGDAASAISELNSATARIAAVRAIPALTRDMVSRSYVKQWINDTLDGDS